MANIRVQAAENGVLNESEVTKTDMITVAIKVVELVTAAPTPLPTPDSCSLLESRLFLDPGVLTSGQRESTSFFV